MELSILFFILKLKKKIYVEVCGDLPHVRHSMYHFIEDGSFSSRI